jgi:hypothetical protein
MGVGPGEVGSTAGLRRPDLRARHRRMRRKEMGRGNSIHLERQSEATGSAGCLTARDVDDGGQAEAPWRVQPASAFRFPGFWSPGTSNEAVRIRQRPTWQRSSRFERGRDRKSPRKACEMIHGGGNRLQCASAVQPESTQPKCLATPLRNVLSCDRHRHRRTDLQRVSAGLSGSFRHCAGAS